MKIVIAPNALKGSCTAAAAAAALAAGAARAAPQARIIQVPVADGGDGLAAVLTAALGGEVRRFQVTGPRGAPVGAALLWLAETRTAVIEMAEASGLALLSAASRDPTATSTLGTGELIRAALDLGARRIMLGLGGSATNDGGIGMASVLGWRFLDATGAPVPPNGAGLAAIARIEGSGVDPRLAATRIDALYDVDNPLTGPRGAAAVYGPQKGATPAQVEALNAGLAHLADLIARDLDPLLWARGGAQPPPTDASAANAVADLRTLRERPGAGAAGGLGAGLVAFCGAGLAPGAELVLDLLDLDRHLTGATLVITAEGCIDTQTAQGKAPAAVAACARRHNIPCIAIVGAIGAEPGPERERLHQAGLTALLSLCPGPIALADAEAQAQPLLAAAAEQAVRAFLAGKAATITAADGQRP